MGFSYFLMFSCFLLQLCHANNTITPAQSLRDGQTIVSTGGKFTLGFFSPGNSQKRYVGMWFTKTPGQTIVWVANRESPIPDSTGVLKIGADGNLVVSDGTGLSIWSSKVSIPGNESSAKLMNSGNLVLTDHSSGFVLWQSFDQPSNTLIEGMKVELDLKTGENQLYRSWKNPNDPSPGNFSFGVDPNGISQLFVWNGSIPLWRTGQWVGRVFTGIPEMHAFYAYGFDFIRDNQQGKLYLTFLTYNSTVALRLVIDDYGHLQQFQWLEGMEDWSIGWSAPNKECEFYNRCGAFGICSEDGFHGCNCLKGFVPRYAQDWEVGNWTGGCVRRTELGCEGRNGSNLNGEGDGFLILERMKLPDSNGFLEAEDVEGCKRECLKNCACVGFSYSSGSGCLAWLGDMVDLWQFSEPAGEQLYIRLAASELGEKKKISIAIIIVVVVIGTIILGVCSYFLLSKVKQRGMVKQRDSPKKETSHGYSIFDLSNGAEPSTNILNSNMTGDSRHQRNGPMFPIFNLDVILTATNSFSFANKLGEGGFGPIYKGTLSNGREIAVKRLSRRSGQGIEEFKNEIVLIAKLQHRNLVRLLGCCIQEEEKMLVYEYMCNKSLDAFLFDPNKRSLLDWDKRFHIIEGIARGLLYLHRDSTLRIIHRDLKASNILLDAEMNPKISDFGMARIFGGNQTQANTNRVVGTYGYMSPEYAMEGLFSMKSDVFSFGVLLLEIVSGRRNTSFYKCEHSLNLIGYAWKLWNENKWIELMDPFLGDSCPKHEVLKCVQMGLLCVQEDIADRPTMSYVVSMLENETLTPPLPKEPAFSIRRRETNSAENNIVVCSINNVTISTVNGR